MFWQEYDLAYADGMNAFAAAVVLAQTSFGNFLKMSPEARYAEFAPFIGGPRVVSVISCFRISCVDHSC
jgi:hypothetical protein